MIDGQHIEALSQRELKPLRKKIQMIFQTRMPASTPA
jgi:ABC-type methionine transport system ATPase subunit